MKHFSYDAQAVGYRWLIDHYNLKVLPHFRWSYLINQGARRVLSDEKPVIYLYDQGYKLDDENDPLQQLTFALKHEGLNLEIIAAFFGCITFDAVHAHVAQQPTGKYQRIIWYLFEKMLGKSLPISDLKSGPYVNLLDDDLYYTAVPRPQRRYLINDNLLGNFAFCPFVRKTAFLTALENKHLDNVAHDLIKNYDVSFLERANNYLYAHETMSSYQIEREVPSKQRLARFINVIKKAADITILTEKVLIELQNAVVDERFANHSFRSMQNYVGEVLKGDRQLIHYVCPKPEDVRSLMEGLFESLEVMMKSDVHPIVIAATISFGFVFIHPFEDGNGRLHRFLIHYILHRMGFTPQGMIFPVSATILADMKSYNDVLESYSVPLKELITGYDIDDRGLLTVHQKTDTYYRFIDYTVQTEYLAACIEKTISTDFKVELKFLANYDKAKKALSDIIDMPDKLLDLFITLVHQNGYKLSQAKRAAHFAMLTDEEIKKMEVVLRQIFGNF